MAKVSIGLRGWRFDEDAVFGPDGRFRPLDEMDPGDRERLIRLVDLVQRPCSACYLVYDKLEPCRQATVVYGEPGSEVLLCDAHEPDFVYWYREAGGSAHRGDDRLRTAFHDWFDDGGRAPDDYAGLDHVETDPDRLPDPPDAAELREELEAGVELERIDLRAEALEDEGDEDDEEPLTTADLARTDLDLDADYPGEG
ncbi:MAG: hypothetical protein ABEJ43_00475 [Haloferacaceae archaeon]